ncbi:unnamed protein product [Prunus brigantina]
MIFEDTLDAPSIAPKSSASETYKTFNMAQPNVTVCQGKSGYLIGKMAQVEKHSGLRFMVY